MICRWCGAETLEWSCHEILCGLIYSQPPPRITRGFPCKRCGVDDCGNPYFHHAMHRTQNALAAASEDQLGRLTEADFGFCPPELPV